MLKRSVLAAIAALTAGGLPVSAAIVNPTNESFISSNNNWKANATSFPDATFVASGSPFGDGYITYGRDLGTAGATSTQVLFRGQDNFSSSAGAFIGNWPAAGVTEFSFWIRHNAPAAMTFGARFAPINNFPAFAAEELTAVPANTWTKITFDIYQGSPDLAYEGTETATSFNEIFGNLAKIQLFTKRGSVPENTVVTFDADQVSAVPEPGMLAPAGLILVGLLKRKRRED